MLFLLLLTVLILPIFPAASEFNYPRILDHPWDHSPITVYIDNKSVPPHYIPTYYTQVQKALNYWAEGGNGKLDYTPVFEVVDSEKADIRIRWVENLQKDQGAPSRVAGDTIPFIVNGRFIRVDIMLGVGYSQWGEWVSYSDIAMLAIAEHELGHALGLDHSNDKQDIMYPTNEQINNTNPILSKYGSLLLFAVYAVLAIVVFLSVSYILRRVTK
ncbi:matrixin family metalloprotease [Methanosarcina sp. UBA5]|uniref:matrixin family metalloprotease n=1 Tax=Methanosarcina sp. UBA5 TaxID=1915593 RepID=UPI0025F1066D|nr:matrixin family metalloprotease [Methanosarcina sp. UBA5]